MSRRRPSANGCPGSTIGLLPRQRIAVFLERTGRCQNNSSIFKNSLRVAGSCSMHARIGPAASPEIRLKHLWVAMPRRSERTFNTALPLPSSPSLGWITQGPEIWRIRSLGCIGCITRIPWMCPGGTRPKSRFREVADKQKPETEWRATIVHTGKGLILTPIREPGSAPQSGARVPSKWH
jgi:hypothetical protein